MVSTFIEENIIDWIFERPQSSCATNQYHNLWPKNFLITARITLLTFFRVVSIVNHCCPNYHQTKYMISEVIFVLNYVTTKPHPIGLVLLNTLKTQNLMSVVLTVLKQCLQIQRAFLILVIRLMMRKFIERKKAVSRFLSWVNFVLVCVCDHCSIRPRMCVYYEELDLLGDSSIVGIKNHSSFKWFVCMWVFQTAYCQYMKEHGQSALSTLYTCILNLNNFFSIWNITTLPPNSQTLGGYEEYTRGSNWLCWEIFNSYLNTYKHFYILRLDKLHLMQYIQTNVN